MPFVIVLDGVFSWSTFTSGPPFNDLFYTFNRITKQGPGEINLSQQFGVSGIVHISDPTILDSKKLMATVETLVHDFLVANTVIDSTDVVVIP